MKIVLENTDIALRHRYWVDISTEIANIKGIVSPDVIILKFQKMPKLEQEVFNAATAYIANATAAIPTKEQLIAEIEEKIVVLNDEKTKLETEPELKDK